MRLSTRFYILIILLLALNLWALLEVRDRVDALHMLPDGGFGLSKTRYPLGLAYPGFSSPDEKLPTILRRIDPSRTWRGSVFEHHGYILPDGSAETHLVVVRPRPPTPIESFSPIIWSVCFSIVCLMTVRFSSKRRRREPRVQRSETETLRRPRRGALALVLAVAAMDVSALVMSEEPPPDDFAKYQDYKPFSDPWGEYPAYRESPLPDPTRRKSPGWAFGTIEYLDNGSVRGYLGNPGDMTGRPIWILPPVRTFLGMHWPKLASLAVTVVSLTVLGRRIVADRKASRVVTESRSLATADSGTSYPESSQDPA